MCGWVTASLGICEGLFCQLPWLPPPPSREGSGQQLRTGTGVHRMPPGQLQLHSLGQQGTTSAPLPPPSSGLLPWGLAGLTHMHLGCDRTTTIPLEPLGPEPPSRTGEALSPPRLLCVAA